jgi:CRISPR-associated endonuclease/helicase Cas3
MTYTISPYFIEPSLWSDEAYVVGHSDVHDGLATFKVKRIERAVLTTERFAPPDDFDEQELLRFAWGIRYSDEEPVTVRLKFTGHQAVRRLKESIWHPDQKISDNDDGSCIWEARVAEPQEMLPSSQLTSISSCG